MNEKIQKELRGTVDEPDSKINLLGKAVDGLMNILRITETFSKFDHSVFMSNKVFNTKTFQVNQIISGSLIPTPTNKEISK